MNILFICDEYPPGPNGGIGSAVQILSRELVKQGHRVFVAGLYSYQYGEKDYEVDQGVSVWRFRYGPRLPFAHHSSIHKIYNRTPGIIKRHLNGKNAFNRFIAFIRQLISNEKIQVIETPDWHTFAMRIGFPVIWPEFEIPFIVKSHGSYTYFEDEMGRRGKRHLIATDKALFARADALSAVSNYTANRNRILFSIREEIRVLYNGIEVNSENALLVRVPNQVTFTGTLMVKKGIFQLIEAWKDIQAKIPGARLLVFGKGKQEALKKILGPDAANGVEFRGHVNRRVLLKELARSSVAVFPSYSETFGLAAVEAMSVGCPVIFTKRSCGPEIINNGENGELVDPDDIKGISAAVQRILSDPDKQRKYSEDGLRTVRDRFNIVNSAEKHIAFYLEVICNFKA